MMVAAQTPAVTRVPPGYRIVQRLDLSALFGLAEPWTAILEAPTGPSAQTGDAPLRVCFTGPVRPATAACDAVLHDGYGFQTLVDARVELLSKATGARALVVRADYTAGGDGMRATAVWAYEGPKVGFLNTFTTTVSDLGEAKRIASGPLAGDYVTADFVTTRPNETRWGDPHRFSIRVYRLDPSYDGYIQVLQYITATTYPAEREAGRSIVDTEAPTIDRRLHDLYPAGPPP